MALPNPIDDDAHRDRLLEDGSGEFKAATAFGEQSWLVVAKDREEAARALVSEPVRAAAEIDLRVDGLLDVAHAVDVRELLGQRLLHGLDIVAQGLNERAPI